MSRYPKAWWIFPLALLLVLKALMLLMAISGIIRANVSEAVGISEDRVDVDGLNVTMKGFSSRAEADQAEEIAKDDVAWTRNVVALVDDDAASNSGNEAAGASAVSMVATEGRVVLAGVVASEEAKASLVEVVEGQFGPDTEIVDELTVDSGLAVEGGTVTVSGEADDQTQKTEWVDKTNAVANAAGLAVVDEVSLAAPSEPVDVQEELNKLFELEPIEFDTSQATIRPDSQETLDLAAQILTENPEAGKLRVVGHTDGDGSDAANQALSTARAQAVVEYLTQNGGVPEDRLESEGRGESELKVSPETSPEDKQRNRRIEWELVE